MRDFKNMKRQRGRNRSGGAGGSSGGGKPQQNANRAFESNGPDNLKIRGHAQHVFEKYQQLSRDAMSAGDRVLAENFLQHAEHYFRLIRTLQPNRPYTDIVSRESFAAGYDIDFEEEGGEGGEEQPEAFAEGGEGSSADERNGDYRDQQPRQDRWENRQGGEGQNRPDQNRQDQNRQDQGRQDRQTGGDRQDYNRDQNRQDQNKQGGYANGRNGQNAGRDRNFNRDRNDRWENRGAENRDGQPRDQADRAETQGSEERRPERQDRYEPRPEREGYSRREGAYGERAPQTREAQSRDSQNRDTQNRDTQNRDPLPVVEPEATPLISEAPAPTDAVEGARPAAKPARTRVLRSRDGDESHTPAFLQAASVAAPVAAEGTPVKRPRGRPKKVEAAPPETEEV